MADARQLQESTEIRRASGALGTAARPKPWLAPAIREARLETRRLVEYGAWMPSRARRVGSLRSRVSSRSFAAAIEFVICWEQLCDDE